MCPQGGNWLIVWDNVEAQAAIRPYLGLNSKSVSMLVTTRYPEEAAYFRSRGPLVRLQTLSLGDSKELFMRHLGPGYCSPCDMEESRAVQVLLQKMDGLPLGIYTMATRIFAKGQSVRSFLRRYRSGRSSSVSGELADYDVTLEKVWNDDFKNFKEMRDSEGTDSFGLLGVLSFCSPETVPSTLFVSKQPGGLGHKVPMFCDNQDRSVHSPGLLIPYFPYPHPVNR